MKGLFITFEGPDGSGKTTQLKLLAEYLEKEGYELITTREPGGTNISDQIRQILLDPSNSQLIDQTEILLYAASRAQLVHQTIIPALKLGKIVLCDRYIDASIAYQAYGLQIDRNIVEQVNSFASSMLTATRTYMLDLAPETGKERMLSRSINEFNSIFDRIEQKDIEYHNRVYKGFLDLAQEQTKRIFMVDANQPKEVIFEQIKSDIKDILKNFKREE